MKNFGFVLLILLFAISCAKEKTISEELVGEWVYERETFNSFSTFEDPDTQGNMTLRKDETGDWIPSLGFTNFEIEWDLQADDTKISITKSIVGVPSTVEVGTIYTLNRMDEDNFTITRHIKFEAVADTLEPFEQFENIILTRLE